MKRFLELSKPYEGIKSSRKIDSSEWYEFEEQMLYETKENRRKSIGSQKRALDVIVR